LLRALSQKKGGWGRALALGVFIGVMFGSAYGYSRCSECGLSMPVAQMEEHKCNTETLVSHQSTQARKELDDDDRIWSEICKWIIDPKLRSYRDFYAWLEEHERV
jgi:hypothetical protein